MRLCEQHEHGREQQYEYTVVERKRRHGTNRERKHDAGDRELRACHDRERGGENSAANTARNALQRLSNRGARVGLQHDQYGDRGPVAARDVQGEREPHRMADAIPIRSACRIGKALSDSASRSG